MIRVDLDRREIRASVGDLVAPPEDLPRPAGPLALARAQIGTTVHQGYRRERERDTPGFRGEVSVSATREVDGFAARIRGRADGVIKAGPNRLVVEEVKSVGATALGLAGWSAADLADAKLQVRLYALCLAEERPDAQVLPRLILVSIVDGSRREIEVEFDPDRVRRRLDQLLRRSIVVARAAAERADRRRALADGLRFPYPEERLYQPELRAEIAKALRSGRPILVQAPTGIGKTAAALLPALSFVLERDGSLFFLTAKNTQQELVARTFEDVATASGCPQGALRALTFREKRRMCPPGTLLCHPDHCAHYEGFLDRTRREDVLATILEGAVHVHPDSVFAAGQKATVCPYALALALSLRVDLVICDYNYVYDPAVSFSLFAEGAPKRRIAVVADEAHNLFDRAREYYSPFLSRRAVESVERRVAGGDFRADGDADRGPFLPRLGSPVDAEELFAAIGGALRAIRDRIDETIVEAEREHPASLEGCRPIRPDPGPWQVLADAASQLLVRYAHYVQAHGLVRPDDPLVELLCRVMSVRDLLVLEEPEFVPYAAAGADAPEGLGVGVLCVDPAAKLAERHDRLLGTVAMSATLEPLSYYADVLGFGRTEPVEISFPSPFPEENRRILIDPSISTTWRERKRHYPTIARIVETVASARPGNYVAYFPSFRFLRDVQERLRWPKDGLLVQEPRMSPEARERVLRQLRSAERPLLLLAVMGGIFAEGIDLPGEALVGAVVVGPGLPSVGFERAVMQHHFEERTERGFAYAMLYPGLRRVIQSAGRVHRSPDDRGVVVLLGRRFARSPYLEHLPGWWSRYGPEAMVSEDPGGDLRRFWDGG